MTTTPTLTATERSCTTAASARCLTQDCSSGDSAPYAHDRVHLGGVGHSIATAGFASSEKSTR